MNLNDLYNKATEAGGLAPEMDLIIEGNAMKAKIQMHDILAVLTTASCAEALAEDLRHFNKTFFDHGEVSWHDTMDEKDVENTFNEFHFLKPVIKEE